MIPSHKKSKQDNSQNHNINGEPEVSEPPSGKAAAAAVMEVTQHSSLETHEDIAPKGDCSVAV